jgi:transcriptional regulator of arginine metabolism
MLSAPMVSTRSRRLLIRQLLEQGRVHSQAELQALLGERGVAASQPVLSRDLRALKVAKQDGAYLVHENERVTPLAALKSLLRDSAPVAALEMVRCESGAAHAVARALEAEGLSGLLGTVAGDDTVLALLSSRAAGERVRRKIRQLL